jgi:2-methylisocitrate lyase-like PEP mutase family enzyme
LRELGFQLVVCPLAALFAAAKAVEDVLVELRDAETTAGLVDRLLGFDELNELVHLSDRYADEARYA